MTLNGANWFEDIQDITKGKIKDDIGRSPNWLDMFIMSMCFEIFLKHILSAMAPINCFFVFFVDQGRSI
jgi:hypothetical protein